ncbi:MAG: hypothetical protein J0H61_02475 [Alphaproteobacteria bacterium]|nr:hypothetical protein [Alphaproteobacteria bacterium]
MTYEIGYKRPPTQTQFKKGVSANPKGRPKKGAVDRGSALLKALDVIVSVKQGDRRIEITAREAIVLSVAQHAMSGDPKAIDTLLMLSKCPGDLPSTSYLWAGDWGVPHCKHD